MEIYLDNAATTKPSKALLPLFSAHVESEWKNPSAMYPPAVAAERQLRADVYKRQALSFQMTAIS